MDLGVWSLRNVDACFTLLETGTSDNLTAGDQIRRWSRTRVHRDFFPHYLDQPLVFPSREEGPGKPPNWPKGHLDYVLLSGLSCSPNQLYYLPTKTGIPAADKREMRKWLDWGRKNVEYLKVRKDLPDWPRRVRWTARPIWSAIGASSSSSTRTTNRSTASSLSTSGRWGCGTWGVFA